MTKECGTSNNLIFTAKKVLTIYIWFAFFFYSISFLGGGGVRFREAIPWYVLISRDIVWLGTLAYLGYCARWIPFHSQLWETDYGKFLKMFAYLCLIYLAIVLIHLTHRDLREIVQHDIRNILSYSLILPFLPFILQEKEDIYSLINVFLNVGMVLSLFGIATRYISLSFLTWHGRIVSTMSDPNNLGIFLLFCILLLVANWERLGFRKAILYFLTHSFALVLTNSVTAFLTANFALFVMLVLKKGWGKGFVISFAIFYLFICFSFMTKLVEATNILSVTNTDKYLVDRLENISEGKFSKLFLFGIKLPLSEPNIRTVAYRKVQLETMLRGENAGVKELIGIKRVTTLFGNFESKKYATLDNQYFNFIVNSGIASAFIFFGLFTWGGVIGIKNYLCFLKTDKDFAAFSLAFATFLLSMTLVGFNGAAFLNRFPLNFLMWLSLGVVFIIQEQKTSKNKIEILC